MTSKEELLILKEIFSFERRPGEGQMLQEYKIDFKYINVLHAENREDLLHVAPVGGITHTQWKS